MAAPPAAKGISAAPLGPPAPASNSRSGLPSDSIEAQSASHGLAPSTVKAWFG
jgi:hypothetical protein